MQHIQTTLSQLALHPAPALKTPPGAKPASGNSGSANSPDAARLNAIERILALFHLAYDREPPTGAERTAKVAVWSQALQSVPSAHLLPLARAELQARESSFFPAPADLLRRWNERRTAHFTPEGAANSAAYLPYAPSSSSQLPQSAEALPPLQIEPHELKRRLGLIRESPLPTEPPPEVPLPTQRWSPLLGDVARAGNIALDHCTPSQIAQLRAFALWWLATYPHRDLFTIDFPSAYAHFQQQETKCKAEWAVEAP